MNTHIDPQDSENANLVAEAYLAPRGEVGQMYRPHNVRFWTAVAVIIIGELSFFTGFALLYRLVPLYVGALVGIGLVLAWQARSAKHSEPTTFS